MRRSDGQRSYGSRERLDDGNERKMSGWTGEDPCGRSERMLSDRQLRKLLGAGCFTACPESGLREATCRAMEAFAEYEAGGSLSALEFLYQQGRYIRKRWWVLQAGVLFLLWCILQLTERNIYVQRCMGIAAPLFAVLLLPELWKNRNAHAMEVECTAYYSLRQIYGARLLLFGLVDLSLLSGFALNMVLTGKMIWEELLIQFLLPFVVACCICFRCLYSRLGGSEAFALFLCMAWMAVWVEIVLREGIYEAISRPVWLGLLAAAVFYLGYCLYRGQRECKKMWEGKPSWN